MAALRQITIEIPETLASEVDAADRIGGPIPASTSSCWIACRSGCIRPATTDLTLDIERWLRRGRRVRPTNAYKADPTDLVSEEEAFRDPG